MTHKIRSVVFDVPNISYEVASVHKAKGMASDPEMLAGISMHTTFIRLNKYFRDLNPDIVVIAFEGGNNWRKEYTASPVCISKKPYKGNRVSDPAMKFYYDMLSAFKETVSTHTSIICLDVPKTEGDDVIATYCQQYASDTHEVIVVSGDKDFLQLLRNPNVKLLNQRDGKYRNTPGDKIYYEDLDYFIFEKCVVGDKGDWVFPIIPGRIMKAKVKKAYLDPHERLTFMKQTWQQEDGTTVVAEDLFAENQILMDLTCQPKEIKDYLDQEVRRLSASPSKYSNFHFLKFLGQFKLKQIAQEIHKFQDMFIRNTLYFKGDFSYRNKKDTGEERTNYRKADPVAMLDRMRNKKEEQVFTIEELQNKLSGKFTLE